MLDVAVVLVPALLVGSVWGLFALRRVYERKYGTAWRPTPVACALMARAGWDEGRGHWLHGRAQVVPTVHEIIDKGVAPGAVEAWLLGWKAGITGKSLDLLPALMEPHMRRWCGGGK